MRTTNSGSGKVTYLTADTQASTQLAIDAATGATTRRRYTPFGDERSGALPAGSDHGFLGQTEDESTGLSLLGARAYDPALGRFLSPDPLSVPYDPQNLSAYSYSHNDPINFSDPSGLIEACGPGHDLDCPHRDTGGDHLGGGEHADPSSSTASYDNNYNTYGGGGSDSAWLDAALTSFVETVNPIRLVHGFVENVKQKAQDAKDCATNFNIGSCIDASPIGTLEDTYEQGKDISAAPIAGPSSRPAAAMASARAGS
ncbi:RHS repeat-associated core domain-containing protein [Streptomyces sp. NBC_01378]|uniref:RHS repeat-associated core domain-containing protein n=1 Tax=Streptomyces sp. NBC_00119 TaxID=2975659 RepID=A0AAU1UM05_9ACTN